MPFLPFIPFPDCADIVLRFVQQGVPWFLTLGAKFNTAVTLADLQNLVNAIDSWFTTDLSPRISTNCTLQDIKVSGLTTNVDPVIVQSPTTSTGSLAGTVLPAQAAMVVTFSTALRGRSYRGRNYVAGRVASEQFTVTEWNSVPIAAMNSAYANLPGQIGPSGWSHVILSRQNGGVRRTVGHAEPVVGYTAKALMATQRKRLT